ncbi:MAG: hypothetical protein EBU90_23250 [Proteobacteria bacterium]|nr:hypothetical protein [Pseudomonadota bacterium]NBP14058.1 hypothetical protein [bacterium]
MGREKSMKSLRFLFLLFIVVSYSYTTNHRPITFIIDNKTDKAVELILEYKIDQYYQHPKKSDTPFAPHYIQVHYIPTIQAGKQVTFLPDMNECLPAFCFLDSNLKKQGFSTLYKVIYGNVTIQDYNYSFDFKETVSDNSIIRIELQTKNQIALSITS